MKQRYASLLGLGLALVSGITGPFAARAENTDGTRWTRSDLPPVQAVVREALGRLPRSFEERQDWLERMRRAAWLPQIQVQYLVSEDFVDDIQVFERTVVQTEYNGDEVTHGGGETETVFGDPMAPATVTETRETDREATVTTRKPTRIVREEGLDSVQTGNSRRSTDEWGVLLTWNLSAFVFPPDEARAAAADARIERFKLEFIDAIVNYYYDLVEAMAFVDADPQNVRMAIQVERNISKLDVLTGGYVTRYLADTVEARKDEQKQDAAPVEVDEPREP